MKSVLFIEPNNFHYECIPGFAYYLTEMGYQVDCFVYSHEDNYGDEFALCSELKAQINIMYFDKEGVIDNVRKKLSEKEYYFIFLNTLDYCVGRAESAYNEISKIDNTVLGVIGCYHLYRDFISNRENYKEKCAAERIVALSPVRTSEGSFTEVNPNYFKKYNTVRHKNKKLQLLSIGVSMHLFELTNLVWKYFSENDRICHLIFIGKNASKKYFRKAQIKRTIVYPIAKVLNNNRYCSIKYKPIRKQFRKHISLKGMVTFEEMFSHIESADFLIINIASNNPYPEDFHTNRTSGIKQLALGFCKPPIIERKMAEYY